jgi:hypothetical protein
MKFSKDEKQAAVRHTSTGVLTLRSREKLRITSDDLDFDDTLFVCPDGKKCVATISVTIREFDE